MSQNLPQILQFSNKYDLPEINTFADFLYELQLASNLGVETLQKSRDEWGHYGGGIIVADLKPFYNALDLGGCTDYKEFRAVAKGDQEPSEAFLLSLHNRLNGGDKNAISWARRLRKLPAPDNFYFPRDKESYLSDFLDQKLNGDPRALYKLADKMDVFPSTIKAIISNSIIASKDIRNHIYRYYQLDESLRALMEADYGRYIEAARTRKPQSAWAMQCIGSITKETNIPNLLYESLKEPSPVNRSDLTQFISHEKLESILSDRRYESRAINRKTYNSEDIECLAQSMLIDSSAQKVFCDLGKNRSLGDLLEEYVMAGNKNWGQFICCLARDWNFNFKDLGEELGVHSDVITRWASGEVKEVKLSTAENLVHKFELTGEKKDWLYALSRGDLSYGITFEDAIRDLQKEMHGIKDPKERSVFVNTAFRALFSRSGFSNCDLATDAKCSTGLVQSLLFSNKAPSAQTIPIMPRIAKALAPGGTPLDLVRDAGLLLNGVPEYRSLKDMFTMVVANEISAGEMIHEYRLQLGMSSKEFGQWVGGYLSSEITKCESTVNGNTKLLQAIAKKMAEKERSITEAGQRTFVRRARGLKGVQEEEIEDLLKLALKGEASFADIVNYIIKTGYAVLKKENVGASELARDLGVRTNAVINWHTRGYHVKRKEFAEHFTKAVKIPDRLAPSFISVATNSVAIYKPETLRACNPNDLASRKRTFKEMLSNMRLSQIELAEVLGIKRDAIKHAISKGYWTSPDSSIANVAAALIPDSHAEDRHLLCAIFESPKSKLKKQIELKTAEILEIQEPALVAP